MMFCKLHLVDSRCLFSAFKPERTQNAAQHMQKADSNNCSKLFLSALFIRKPVCIPSVSGVPADSGDGAPGSGR